MPRYDYDCAACGRRFEVSHGIEADPPTACPLCGSGPVRKAFAAPAIHFKGSGWAKKERRATSSPGRSSSDSNAAGSSDGANSTADDAPAAASTDTSTSASSTTDTGAGKGKGDGAKSRPSTTTKGAGPASGAAGGD